MYYNIQNGSSMQRGPPVAPRGYTEVPGAFNRGLGAQYERRTWGSKEPNWKQGTTCILGAVPTCPEL